MKIIINNIDKLNEILAFHKVKELRAFGSVVKMNFNEKSDLDFVITFEDIRREKFASNFFHLEKQLRILFNRKIDLCIYQDLIGSIFWESIKGDFILIYKNYSNDNS